MSTDGALWISVGSGLECKISDNEGFVPENRVQDGVYTRRRLKRY